ncbi:MAG: hypothetical protein ABEJ73_12845 [Haloplanus sp.]
MPRVIDDARREALVRACRAAIGDTLRSIVYFTPDEFTQVYLRDDLRAGADLGAFVRNERAGFDRQNTDLGSELGSYNYTIHGYDEGYLLRVIAGDHGVFVTTDDLPIARFEEVVTAVHDALDEPESTE